MSVIKVAERLAYIHLKYHSIPKVNKVKFNVSFTTPTLHTSKSKITPTNTHTHTRCCLLGIGLTTN